MPIGKLAAQAGHASSNCLALAALNNPDLFRLYQGPKFLGTKITMAAKTESQLRDAYTAAKSAGLITTLIEDEGHVLPPHFDGNPIITALGIGPCTRLQADKITKRFGWVK